MNEYAAEVERINGNVASTYTALSEMGATMPAQQNSDNLPETVRTVPHGGNKTVQTDWNQTDETAPDFLKNKPFGDVPVVVMEEQELVYDAEMQACMGMTLVPIQEKNVLKLVVDGESYECDPSLMYPYIIFGNLGFLGTGEDTGEPFAGMYAEGMVTMVFMDELNHTVGITAYQAQKISPKYMDVKTVFYKKPGADKYLYTDNEFTIKATKSDITKTVSQQPIMVALESAYFLSAITVFVGNDYAKVYVGIPTTDGSLGFEFYYTAEYTG